MQNYEPKPVAVFHKSHAIYCAICNGNAAVAEIADATGFPATTILRIAAILVDDEMVDAKVAGGKLFLTRRTRYRPDAFN